jgi:hypothetical protein
MASSGYWKSLVKRALGKKEDDMVLGNNQRELVSLTFDELQPNEQAKVRDLLKEHGINLVSSHPRGLERPEPWPPPPEDKAND